MKLTYLGSGNAFAPQRSWGCVLVNDTILLDAGPGALLSMKRLGLDPARIRQIFLSHFHADHFFGLTFLLLEYYFLSRTDAPLTIVGPPGVEERVRHLMAFAYPELAGRGWPRPITFVEATPGAAQSADGLDFSAVPMAHVPEFLSAFGYRLQLPDGILAYSDDTAMTDALYTLIDGAQVCVVEATSQETSAVHLGRQAIAEVLARLPEPGRLFLTHLDTPGNEAWQGMRVVAPNDLQTYLVDTRTGTVRDTPGTR